MSAAEITAICDSKLQAQLTDIAIRAVALTGSKSSALALKQGDTVVTVANYGDCAPDVGVSVLPSSFAGQCLEQADILICDDTDTDPRVDAAGCRALGIRSMIAAPIIVGGKPEGVLAVFSALPRAFVRSRAALISTLTTIAGDLIPPDPTRRVIPAVATAVDPVSTAQPQRTATVHVMPSPATRHDDPVQEPEVRKNAPADAGDPRALVENLLLDQSQKSVKPSSRAADKAAPEAVLFAQMDSSGAGSGKRGIVIGIAAAVLTVAAIGGWLYTRKAGGEKTQATNAPVTETVPQTGAAATPNTAPASNRKASSKPAPASQPSASQSSEKQSPSVVVPPPPMVIRQGSAPRRQEQADVSAPSVTMAGMSTPALTLSTRPYVPNAPAASATPAQVLRKVVPVYPSNTRVTGKVNLTATVQKDGKIGKVVVTSGHALLRQAATTAIRQWVYRPAYLNGQPVESAVDIEVNFTSSSH